MITEKPERDSKVKISVLKNAIKYIIYTEHRIRDKLSGVDGFGPVNPAEVLLIAEGEEGTYSESWLIAGTKYYKHASETEGVGFNEKT